MNDSTNKKDKITLAEIRRVSIATLLKLDIETLRDLEDQADKAVFSAGLTLDWVRGIIARKTHQQTPPDDKAGA